MIDAFRKSWAKNLMNLHRATNDCVCEFINISVLRHDFVSLENPVVLFKIVRLAVNRSRGLAGAFIFQKWDFVIGFGDDHTLVTDAGKGKIFEFANALA